MEISIDNRLEIIDPPFSSPVVDLVVALNNLRDKKLDGTTEPRLFFQIKEIFQMVESLESARIEGNHTTLVDYVAEKLNVKKTNDEQFLEISNIQKAMDFVEEYFQDGDLTARIDRMFILQLHKMVVSHLQNEGDRTPREYRKSNVKIGLSKHVPPDHLQVSPYMDKLIHFINNNDKPKYDLLKTAIAHHAFVWIHPFTNGNGRTVRLLTYAMLIKQGFNISTGRILNPTAVFCNDREKYYHSLGLADTGTTEGKLAWCEYVLGGLKEEIEKIDQLLSSDQLINNILLPALKDCFETKKIISSEQYDWLVIAARRQVVKANDFKESATSCDAKTISRKVTKLKEIGLIKNLGEVSRKYHINLLGNIDFLRSIVHQLREKGFVPKNL